ncbi:MAG: alpha-L-fucosidase [Gemmatimonadetes bacterium]|nr:alpha-L-fucosidase [Gemmatimonadota bacterium]
MASAVVPATAQAPPTETLPSAQAYQPTWESLDSRPMPKWFEEAKFGIFIHWGVYSVPAWIRVTEGKYASYAEWYYARVMGELKGDEDFHEKTFGEDFEYRDFAPMFTAELFEPDLWASLFAEAGARYVVLTSKHHDGFCLWPTESPFKANWNSMDVGPKRDLVGDLTDAVRAQGLRMGLYYSMIEWETNRTGRTPSGRFIPQEAMDRYGIPLDRYVDDHVIPQLRELVTEYQPAVIFSDAGEWDEVEEFWKTKEFLAWLYNHAPNKDEVVVNDRWAKGMVGQHGDYYSSEYQDLEGVGTNHPWEESRGMGRSYGYNRAENINHYRTSKELVHELIDVVSRGGNLLLNVGPTADGRIPVIMQQRLRDIGSWLRINGEAIYGTRGWTPEPRASSGADERTPRVEGSSPDESTAAVRYTRKRSDLFAHFLEWPDEEFRIDGLGQSEGLDRAQAPGQMTGLTVRLLGYEGTVEWRVEDGVLIVAPPVMAPSQVPSPYAYVFKISGGLPTPQRGDN